MADLTADTADTRVDGALEKGQMTMLERANTQLQRAGTNITLQRASTLPTEDKELRHAATMPIMHDIESIRPFCCGLWKLQQLVGFLLGVACLLIISLWSPIALNGVSNYMLGITMLCGCFWVFEVIPIYITALLPVVLMPAMKITSSAIAAQAYWDPVQMLVVGTYLVDIALEEVNLPRRAAFKLMLLTGVMQPGLILFVLMFACWILSMVCNNIAVALMIAPFATGLMNAAEMHALDTAAEQMEAQGSESTNRAEASTAEIQRFSVGLLLGIAYSTTAGGMATLVGCIPNELLVGSNDGLTSIITYGKWTMFALPVSLAAFLMAYLAVYLRYVRGLTLKTLTEEILKAEYEELLKDIGPFSRDELIVGVVQILQFVLLFCGTWIRHLNIFETMNGVDVTGSLMGDATLACLPAVLLFVSPSVVRPGQTILTWPVVHEKFDFGLLLLIGGGFAIASGFVQSGLNVALGDWVAVLIVEQSTFVLTLVTVIICTIATQLFSAVGTATTVIPVLQSAAARAVYNPLALVLPATVACSFAFMLPTATPANVVVLAKSRDLSAPLRVRDFFLTGLPINLAMIVIGTFLMCALSPAVFDASGPLPKWACDGVSCVWVDVAGTSHGLEVSSQACTIDLTSQMETCMLANGTWIGVEGHMTPLP